MVQEKKRPLYKPYLTVGNYTQSVLDPLFKTHGYYFGLISLDWSKIIGEELSQQCHPLSLKFKKGEGTGAVLTLRVIPSAALMIGYQKGIIIEKIAVYFGKRIVETIIFQQSHLGTHVGQRKNTQSRNHELSSPPPPLPKDVQQSLLSIEDKDLQTSLEKLAYHVVKNQDE